MWNFNDRANDDLEFLKKLTEQRQSTEESNNI